VIDHYIDTIDNTAGTANWGIGVGFAGSSYDNTYPDSKTVRDFTIAKIRGRRCRQLIHVEAANRFEIADIVAQDVNSTYSVGSGLDVAAVAVFGSINFEIDTVRAYDATRVMVAYGSSGGTYIAAPKNYSILGCKLENTDLTLDAGNVASTIVVKNNRIFDGAFTMTERPGRLVIEGNQFECTRAEGKAMTLQFDLNTDGRGAFLPTSRSTLVMRNNTARDEYNTPSATITGVVQTSVVAEGNNFTLAPTGTVLKPIGRTFRVNTAGSFPYGVEFVEGDLVIDQGGTRWMVTVEGSRNRALDTFEVVSSTVIKSTGGFAWTDVNHHESGQRITLSGAGVAGADLATVVVRTYIEAATYRIEVADAITAAVGATGTVTATAAVTFVVV
jgi:hypothetical protein